MHIQKKTKIETSGRKPAMSNLLVKRLVHESEKDPLKPATLRKKELQIEASVKTVRNRWRESNLKVCNPRKVPLLSSKHVLRNRMDFAQQPLTRQSVNGEIFCGRMREELCCMVEKDLVRM